MVEQISLPILMSTAFRDCTGQSSPKIISCIRNGRLGGLVTARRYVPAVREKWARKGGTTVRDRYGPVFYRQIRKLRKTYKKFRSVESVEVRT